MRHLWATLRVGTTLALVFGLLGGGIEYLDEMSRGRPNLFSTGEVALGAFTAVFALVVVVAATATIFAVTSD